MYINSPLYLLYMTISFSQLCFSSLCGKTMQFLMMISSLTTTSLPRIVTLWILSPFLVTAVLLCAGAGVPSIRDQHPTLEFQPTIACRIQAFCLMSTLSSTIASLTRAPLPILTLGPIETLGPSYNACTAKPRMLRLKLGSCKGAVHGLTLQLSTNKCL